MRGSKDFTLYFIVNRFGKHLILVFTAMHIHAMHNAAVVRLLVFDSEPAGLLSEADVLAHSDPPLPGASLRPFIDHMLCTFLLP